jgi:hypothetical protein
LFSRGSRRFAGRSLLALVATISLGSDWSLRCNPDGSFHSLTPRHAAKKALKRAEQQARQQGARAAEVCAAASGDGNRAPF